MIVEYKQEHLWGDTYKVTKITKEDFIVVTDSPIKDIHFIY